MWRETKVTLRRIESIVHLIFQVRGRTLERTTTHAAALSHVHTKTGRPNERERERRAKVTITLLARRVPPD